MREGAGLAILLIGVAISTAFATGGVPVGDDGFGLRIQEYMARSIAAAPPPKFLHREVSVAPHYPSLEPRRSRYSYWSGCGGTGRMGNFNFEPRATKLPVDPTLVLGSAYLRCRIIKAAIIDSRVPVASYPAGYFGDFEYEGLLVSDWLEFADEAMLRRLFGLSVELAGEPDFWEPDFDAKDGHDIMLADYRKDSGFTPEVLLEFFGETTLRVEINLTTERLLIQAGDRWECYGLDKWRAVALGKHRDGRTK